MHIVIVLNGDPPTPDELTLLDEADAIVCADGGANPVFASDRRPTLIVGDLDSIDPTLVQRAEDENIEIERHPREKDETDGELAVAAALARDPDRVTVLGGHGQRTAMFLGNLNLLRRFHGAGVEASMVGHGEVHWFVAEGGERRLSGEAGNTVNVLPIGASAVVTIEGTGFDVEKLRLAPTAARGVSNEVSSDDACVRVHEGTVLVVLERNLPA